MDCLNAVVTLRLRVTTKEVNDAQICTDRTQTFFFFLLHNMRSEADPIEPAGHVIIDSAIFTLYFAKPEGLLLSRWKSPSEPRERSAGFLGLERAAPMAQRQAPGLQRAQGLHAPENRSHHL